MDRVQLPCRLFQGLWFGTELSLAWVWACDQGLLLNGPYMKLLPLRL